MSVQSELYKRATPEEALEIERVQFTEKQKLFLSSTARYTLYGGATGGGKTHTAIYDAIGFNRPGNGRYAIDFPEYQGLFLRRTVKQLEEVIKNTSKIYPIWGKCRKTGREPRFFEQKKMWVFPSGARILFGYIDRPSDVENYQGWQYQWICFEELTQWPSSEAWTILSGRLRRTTATPIDLVMRATCNPGGVGHHWVRSFWQIDNEGSPNHFSVPEEVDKFGGEEGETEIRDVRRQFIPARLEDNPYINQAEYQANLAVLSPQMQRAWKEGRWDVIDIKGIIYADQINALHNEGRIREVLYDPRYPVNTFWDIGIADHTSVWFHQRVDGIDRFIDFYQAANRGLKDHWRFLKHTGYNFGVHVLPHDADKRQHSLGGIVMTTVDILEDLGMTNIKVLEKGMVRAHGIEAARVLMPMCVFDAHKCEEGITCLTNYRYKPKSDGEISREPVHDVYSHGADAFRTFAEGYEELEDLIVEAANTEYEAPDQPWSRRNVVKARSRPRRYKV